MRRLTAIEIGILVLALLGMVAGVEMLVFPKESVVFHQVYRQFGYNIEHITKTGSRIYGGLLLMFGLGVTTLVFYGKRK